jgi:hypothetical protein
MIQFSGHFPHSKVKFFIHGSQADHFNVFLFQKELLKELCEDWLHQLPLKVKVI